MSMKDTDAQEIASQMKAIRAKVEEGQRISEEEALYLYHEAQLTDLADLACIVRQRMNKDVVYYNRNFHVEPSNICIYNCKFCSYYRDGQGFDAWEMSMEEMLADVREKSQGKATEVHIVGSVHPDRDLHFYAALLHEVRASAPHLHIKAFTAVELEYMSEKAGLSIKKGLEILKESGLGSIPGGGAEIFDEKTRARICPEKTASGKWLEIHEIAHGMGIPSNATMLYGHIEEYHHRVDHMRRLRELQDRTRGFQCFIPLKYRQVANQMSGVDEVPATEDMRNYAVARIYMDNIPHLKSYWPMIGRSMAQAALSFGVDDLDGTIDDSTKIYSLAGAEEQNPSLSAKELEEMITEAGFTPVERDSLYNHIDND